MIDYSNYAGGLHWPELEGLTDIVLIVVLDWFTIQDFQIQKRLMNTEFLFMHAQIVLMTLKDQKCFQLKEMLLMNHLKL